MNPLEEFNGRLKKLRDGEKVPCKKCADGIMKPVGDYKTTHCFVCNKCGNKINLN